MHKLTAEYCCIVKFSKWGMCHGDDGLGIQKSKLHPGLERLGVTPLGKTELHLLTSCLNFRRSVLSPKCQEHLRSVCHHERLMPVLLRKLWPRVPAAGLQWGFLRRAIKHRGRRTPLFFAPPAGFGEDGTEPAICSFCWCKISSEMRDLFRATFVPVVQKMPAEAYSWRESDGLPQASHTLREGRREKKLAPLALALNSKCFLMKLFIFSSSAPGSRQPECLCARLLWSCQRGWNETASA